MAEPLRVLFVCSRNRLRSPTAEAVVADWPGVTAVSAGTAPDADARVSLDLVEWADVVVAFEPRHRRRLAAMFGPTLRDTRVVVLGIPDDYGFMDPALVEALRPPAAGRAGGGAGLDWASQPPPAMLRSPLAALAVLAAGCTATAPTAPPPVAGTPAASQPASATTGGLPAIADKTASLERRDGAGAGVVGPRGGQNLAVGPARTPTSCTWSRCRPGSGRTTWGWTAGS